MFPITTARAIPKSPLNYHESERYLWNTHPVYVWVMHMYYTGNYVNTFNIANPVPTHSYLTGLKFIFNRLMKLAKISVAFPNGNNNNQNENLDDEHQLQLR